MRSPSSASFFDAARTAIQPSTAAGDSPLARRSRELALAERDGRGAALFPLGESGRRPLGEGSGGARVRVERGRDAKSLSRGDERVEQARREGGENAEAASEARGREAGRARLQEEEIREVPLVALLEHGERAVHVRAAPEPEARAPGVEHAPAADRLGGRRPAEDEAVAGARGQRQIQRDLREAGRAGSEDAACRRFGVRPEAVNATRDVGRSEVDAQARPVFEGGRDGRQPRDFDREDGGRLEPPARDESLAATQRRALDAGEVQARPLARLRVERAPRRAPRVASPARRGPRERA